MATHVEDPKRSTSWGWIALIVVVMAGALIGLMVANGHHSPTPTQQWIQHSQQQLDNAPAG